MEPVVPPDPGRSWSALAIPCSACGADVDVYCPGDKFCPARMVKVRDLARSGQLSGEEIRAQMRACPACRKKRNQTGTKWVACSPEHRCISSDRGRQCAAAVARGQVKCDQHLSRREIEQFINPLRVMLMSIAENTAMSFQWKAVRWSRKSG
jgi:hypothetical protein